MFLCKTVTMQAVRALQQSFDREHAYRTERAVEQLRTLARARTVASLGNSRLSVG